MSDTTNGGRRLGPGAAQPAWCAWTSRWTPERLPDPRFAIVDDDGVELPDGEPGELVMRRPWTGTLGATEGAGAEEVARRHFRLPGCYSTYDRARRRPDGTLEFLGRMDEVTSVSGQLVSLGEVHQVLLDHPLVAAAEVVERTDARLGRSLAAAVVLIPDVAAGLRRPVRRRAVTRRTAPHARPAHRGRGRGRETAAADVATDPGGFGRGGSPARGRSLR